VTTQEFPATGSAAFGYETATDATTVTSRPSGAVMTVPGRRQRPDDTPGVRFVAADQPVALNAAAAVVAEHPDPRSASGDERLLPDAAEILRGGDRVSQRVLASQLRKRGHRFSNAQLREIATTACSADERRAA
jgi:hypothetical protein